MLSVNKTEPTLLVLPGSKEHRAFSKNFSIIKDNNLQDAIPYNIYKSKSKRLSHIVCLLLDEIHEQYVDIKNRKRYYDALKTVLINVWHGHFCGKPIMYSRNKSDYSRSSIYGKLHIPYKKLIPIIDALISLEYIDHKMGFLDRNRHIGRTSRMSATPKLWKHFYRKKLVCPGFYSVAAPEEVVILRDKKSERSVNMPIKGNHDFVSLMRKDTTRYNDFIEDTKITLALNKDVMVSNEFLLNQVFCDICNSNMTVDKLKLIETTNIDIRETNDTDMLDVRLFTSCNSNYLIDICNRIIIPYHSYYNSHIKNTYKYRNISNTSYPITITKDFYTYDVILYSLCDFSSYISSMLDKEVVKGILKKVFKLEHIGINELVLRLHYEYIHRVFNRNSLDKGGRFWGAIHQRIPKHLRQHIQINGEQTVELDYSAYHIRMLYHQKGIDYKDDPYSACDGNDNRDLYKAVGLIAINGNINERKKVYGAIREEMKKRAIPIPPAKNPVIELVERFRGAHPDIADCLFADKGVDLMNIDSRIMNNILMRLLGTGIAGLPVHDSIVVGEQHKDFLYEIMMEEYKKEMGFYPIVDVKKKMIDVT